jgi:hypothetical protein
MVVSATCDAALKNFHTEACDGGGQSGAGIALGWAEPAVVSASASGLSTEHPVPVSVSPFESFPFVISLFGNKYILSHTNATRVRFINQDLGLEVDDADPTDTNGAFLPYGTRAQVCAREVII